MELPTYTGTQPTDAAADSHAPDNSSATINSSPSQTQSPETIQDILDLDKHERFRWQGKEWTAKDLKNSYLMHGDYTRKTQKHADEVKQYSQYRDNFHYDLQKVIEDPSLLDELKKVYPKEFVKAAERTLSILQAKSPSTETAKPQSETRQVDPEVEALKEKVAAWEKTQHDAAVEKLTSWVQNQYERLSQKYEFANQAQVTQWSQGMLEQGTEISEALLEKLFKSSNETEKARWDKLYAKKAKEQITTGQRGRDTAGGGGIAGDAPKGPKTLKEAERAMMEFYSKK